MKKKIQIVMLLTGIITFLPEIVLAYLAVLGVKIEFQQSLGGFVLFLFGLIIEAFLVIKMEDVIDETI